MMGLFDEHFGDEKTLARTCFDLGAAEVGGPLWSDERALRTAAEGEPSTPRSVLAVIRREIRSGEDPLGEAFCRIRTGEVRRGAGAFYTACSIVDPMVAWVLEQGVDRVIDPGCGSGRFTIGVLDRQPKTDIIAIDLDPLATLMTRANLAVRKISTARVLQLDFTRLLLPKITGRTGFVGNPPYVRHHDLSAETKRYGAQMARVLGHKFSQLAGLHAHFFLATATNAQNGDVGAFVTSAEWLDVSYGSIVRDLMLNGLGGHGIHVIQPKATAFEDAMTTAAIAYFEAGAEPERLRLSFAKTARLTRLGAAGRSVPRETLASTSRWTPIVKNTSVQSRAPQANAARVPRLGDLVRVSRGQVTGANGFFLVTREHARQLGIEDVCVPAITGAEEIFASNGVIYDSEDRKLLIDPPPTIKRENHPALDEFLRRGEETIQACDLPPSRPIALRYVCSHRKVWWQVGAPQPAIVMTYMARQAPKFALNPNALALINVGHGLYPRVLLSNADLARVVNALNNRRESFRGHGRTYHGGLEKFEPSEVENLPLPDELRDLLDPTLTL